MPRLLLTCLLLTSTLAPAPAALAAVNLAAEARADYQQADRTLNETYKTMTTTIGWGATLKKIVKSEQAWLHYRDAEGDLARDLSEADPEASRYRRMAELTRERNSYLEELISEANGGP